MPKEVVRNKFVMNKFVMVLLGHYFGGDVVRMHILS